MTDKYIPLCFAAAFLFFGSVSSGIIENDVNDDEIIFVGDAGDHKISDNSYPNNNLKNNIRINYNLDTWMTNLREITSNRPLKNLIIPGTHDSGTAPISANNAVATDDKGIPDELVKLSPVKLAAWSKTQDLNIKKQLETGVRFLDFRVSFEKEDGRNNYVLYLSHGLRGEKLAAVLWDVRTFAANHPGEIIIIKVKGFSDKKCMKKGENLNKTMFNLFDMYLERFALTRSEVENLGKKLPLVTLNEMLNLGKNVIVIFDMKSKEGESVNYMLDQFNSRNFLFDAKDEIGSPWGNKQSVPDLVKYTLTTAKDFGDNGKCNNKLYALHWTLTANPKYIITHINSNEGIRYLTKKINGGKNYGTDYYNLKSVLKRIPRVNIVQHDFITEDKVRQLVEMNFYADN